MTEANFPTSDRLAFGRTRLAYERRMMAWTRTSTALITFGFGMYKLFEIVPFAKGLKPGEHEVSPRAFAVVLAFIGNIALLMAAIQHRISLQALRAQGLKFLTRQQRFWRGCCRFWELGRCWLCCWDCERQTHKSESQFGNE
jgi:putative membrane protein